MRIRSFPTGLFPAFFLLCIASGCSDEMPVPGPDRARAHEAGFSNAMEELVSPLKILQVRLARKEIGEKKMEGLELLPRETKERLSRLVEERPDLLQVSVGFRREKMPEKTVYIGYPEKITLDGRGSRMETWGADSVQIVWGRITDPPSLPVPALVLVSRKILDESTSFTLVFVLVPE